MYFETVARSARKTPGPVDLLAQPVSPGSHHQTPWASAGSMATHSGLDGTDKLSGVDVTTYFD